MIGKVLDVDGREMVLVPATVAGRIARVLREVAQQNRTVNGVPIAAEVLAVIKDLERAEASLVIEARAAEVVAEVVEQGISASGNELEAVGRTMPSMSTVAAANALGCTPRQVGNLIHDGQLTGYKVGNAWRVDESSIAALLIERDHATTGRPGA